MLCRRSSPAASTHVSCRSRLVRIAAPLFAVCLTACGAGSLDWADAEGPSAKGNNTGGEGLGSGGDGTGGEKPQPAQPVACTEEAKMVCVHTGDTYEWKGLGRSGPTCAFPAQPNEVDAALCPPLTAPAHDTVSYRSVAASCQSPGAPGRRYRGWASRQRKTRVTCGFPGAAAAAPSGARARPSGLAAGVGERLPFVSSGLAGLLALPARLHGDLADLHVSGVPLAHLGAIAADIAADLGESLQVR
jgi:hypothetical protein